MEGNVEGRVRDSRMVFDGLTGEKVVRDRLMVELVWQRGSEMARGDATVEILGGVRSVEVIVVEESSGPVKSMPPANDCNNVGRERVRDGRLSTAISVALEETGGSS